MAKSIDPEAASAVMRAAGVEPLESFPGARVGWRVRCLQCGSEGKPHYSTVKKGLGSCNVCAKRATAEKLRQRGFDKTKQALLDAGWEILVGPDEYVSQKIAVQARCRFCAKPIIMAPDSLKKSLCECLRPARRPLELDFPELAAELHPTKNSDRALHKIGSGMRAPVWWVCPKGHEYQAWPSLRVAGSGCPFCVGKKTLPGWNDLATVSPAIACEWHKDNPMGPESVAPYSNKSFKWQCPIDSRHIYDASPASRSAGTACPYCAGKRVLPGVNDLASLKPEIAAEWHPAKNGELRPDQVTPHSNKRVVWKCPRGADHEWETSVAQRAGCPFCLHQRASLDNNLLRHHPEIKSIWDFERNKIGPTEVPAGSGRIVFWTCKKNPGHKYRRRISAQLRYGECPICTGAQVKSGINDALTEHPELMRILDPANGQSVSRLRPGSHTKFSWQCEADKSHRWMASVKDAVKYGCGYCDGRWLLPGTNDLASTHPNLAKQWHSALNNLGPQEVKATSNSLAFWQCERDRKHVWRAVISSRARGNNCPYCSNKKVLPGNNDFATKYPALVAQRLPRVREPDPETISKGSKVRYLWQCQAFSDHQWEATVAQRTTHSTGCPICRNLTLKVGFNDLVTSHPEVSRDWHLSKNGTLSPQDVIAGSHLKVWWQCPNVEEHVFKQSIRDHVLGKGCSTCAPRGFRLGKPSKFYFIESKALGSYKVGITNTDASHDRLSKWNKLGWETMEVIQFEQGQPILALETEMLRWLRRERQLPVFLKPQDLPRIGGFSETFARSAIPRVEVAEEIHKRWGRLKNWDWGAT